MARVICQRSKKQSFPTRLDADIERARIIANNESKHRKRSLKDVPTRSYQCEFCGKWHLTSQPKKSTPDADSGI